MNQAITAPRVRLIDFNGEQIGIVLNQEAQQKARAADLDLVEVDPNADPPVCRIEDYCKQAFENKKSQNKSKKKQKQAQIKSIRIKPRIEEADYQVKLKSMVRFLENGDKAKLNLTFRGREMAHPEMGQELLKRIEADLAAYGTVYQPQTMQGRQMSMVFVPLKS